MPDFTASLRLDHIEEASTENGCIDKFKVWCDLTPNSPTTLPTYYVVVPVTINDHTIPLFQGFNGLYLSNLPNYPLDATGGLDQSVSSVADGYAYLTQSPFPVMEWWFHRCADVDISSTAFSDEFTDTNANVWHF